MVLTLRQRKFAKACLTLLIPLHQSANSQPLAQCDPDSNSQIYNHCWNTQDYLTALLPAILTASKKLECSTSVRGTAIPPNSGTPALVNSTNGMVMFANFFNSGAIVNPTDEFVEVCVTDADRNGKRITKITSHVGTSDNAIIKAYPELIVGTKFGITGETSFRPFPAKISSTGFEYPDLVSVSAQVGLPAFTNNLPIINVQLDIDEKNVSGANRDVMMVSWFHDTSLNETEVGYTVTLSGVDTDNDGIDNSIDSDTTGGFDLNSNGIDDNVEIADTLNNMVGDGHPNFPALSNLLLEMMVHIGPLSKFDISRATRNPGQFQLTDMTGNDSNNNGIDDGWDTSLTNGPDIDSDGVDDSKFLPVSIGDHKYSIWYGTSALAPIVIFSRESKNDGMISLTPGAINTNLSDEGLININWNLFLNYTLFNLESLLQSKGVSWAIGANNPFPKMRSSSGAISGLELGVEPQTNAPNNEPYVATIKQYDISIDGVIFAPATDRGVEKIKTGLRGNGYGCSIPPAAKTQLYDPIFILMLIIVVNRTISREYRRSTTYPRGQCK